MLGPSDVSAMLVTGEAVVQISVAIRNIKVVAADASVERAANYIPDGQAQQPQPRSVRPRGIAVG